MQCAGDVWTVRDSTLLLWGAALVACNPAAHPSAPVPPPAPSDHATARTDLGQAETLLVDASLDASVDAVAEAAASVPAPPVPLGPFVATDGEPLRGVIAAEFARPGDERSHVELAAGGARRLALGAGEGGLIVAPFRLVYDTHAGQPAITLG